MFLDILVNLRSNFDLKFIFDFELNFDNTAKLNGLILSILVGMISSSRERCGSQLEIYVKLKSFGSKTSLLANQNLPLIDSRLVQFVRLQTETAAPDRIRQKCFKFFN